MAEHQLTPGAAALLERLKALGWTRYRLEKELGLADGVVYRWCNGQRLPDLTDAIRLRELVDLPVEVWVDESRGKVA